MRVGRLSNGEKLRQEGVVSIVLLLDPILGLDCDASDQSRILGEGDEGLERRRGELESFRLDRSLESCRGE